LLLMKPKNTVLYSVQDASQLLKPKNTVLYRFQDASQLAL
jgi:hypothetical protein